MSGFVILALCFVIFLLFMSKDKPRDDTDPPEGRSGMQLFIDHRTGCHYVGNPMGGIMPRFDAKGKQICDPKQEAR